MKPVFETLTELGEHLAGTGIELVDPGVPLSNWDDAWTYGPAWRNQPSIRKVVGFVARHLASTPLHLYERAADDDRLRVREGPLADLLTRPSRAPGQTAYRFWESYLIDGLLHDKSVAQVIEHVDGFELVRIPARMVRFKGDALGRITEVLITVKGKTRSHDPAGFLIDVGYSERGVNGTSPLRTLQDILDEQVEAVRYRRSVWKNGARVPMVLERPLGARWEETARSRFVSSWQEFTRGGGQEGGTPILEDGMTVKPVNAFRPRDTLDLEGRQLTDVEVASAFYVAPELVGARPGTFANILAFKQMLYGPNLGPYFDAWQQGLNATLVPKIEPSRAASLYIEANIESKLRGSFEEQADMLSTAVGAPWMVRNEARAKLNMPAIDGGDELVTPLNVLVGGQASPQDGKSLGEVLAKFKARQAQVVASQRAAGAEPWDRGRWDRELTDDLVKFGFSSAAAAITASGLNDQAERELLGGGHSDADEDDRT
ncbi:phage portal protein [Agromyces larvae]|uniref:Phage portal protein n=1 Tax=Agromyces larvae TaxID=2929802 RepID=A0ABY4C5M3_9MICO|nr:phage portal protein [Agromyces larvae]UOE45481.1 phage portal protein [Agromyces larvae]